jgi:hypothetical protein
MPQSLSTTCKPRESVFKQDRRATVLNLDNFLNGTIDGKEFFQENYLTNGMETLIDRAFRHLADGATGNSIFHLSQSMGGGKTHSMMALGLLARDPSLRSSVLGDKNPAPKLGKVQVVGFNGRQSDVPIGIWGSVAEQLDKKDQFKAYYSPLSAPGPEAWRTLLGCEPIIILLDELPSYMENARSVSVGNSDLSVVTTTALANLMVAASDMPNAIIVLSDLAGSGYQDGGNLIAKSLANLKNEAKRIALPITPVNPQGDELFHILRCRLFESLPAESVCKDVADRYRASHAEAVKMGLTSSSSDGLFQNVLDAYPFHPAWRELLGRFKENEGFQQTRGVIRLMQMVVSNLWNTKRADGLELIHPYDIDLSDNELAPEIRSINQSLSEAVAHDISHEGTAEVEILDKKNGSNDASEAAKLLLLASLSATAGAVNGLRDFEVYDFLQRPGRDLSALKTKVLDELDIRAWYLHRSQDGRLFFKNQQNLAARLRSTAEGLHNESVAKELRRFLKERFDPVLKDLYQRAELLPALDEVLVEQDRVCLILAEPSGAFEGLALAKEWQDWWAQQTFKNRVMFLTGSKMVMGNVKDAARQYRALESIEEELVAENTQPNDPQWKALDILKDRILFQFTSALTQAFDTLVYPSINNALRQTSIILEFKGNTWRGEEVLRKTLVDAQKFTADVTADVFRQRCEQRLFVSNPSQWAEVKRLAATNTLWQFHRPDALDTLKTEAIRKDYWREEGSYVRKGPFAKAETSVKPLFLSRDDHGVSWLKIEALHGDRVHYEGGSNVPTEASSKVSDFQRFQAKGLRYSFICIDSCGEHPTGAPVEWVGEPDLKYALDPLTRKVTLRSLPAGQISYSTDGRSPEYGGSYDAPFVPPEGCTIVLAVAEVEGIKSKQLKVSIPKSDTKGLFEIDPHKACRWSRRHKLDDSGATWKFIEAMEKHIVTAFDIIVKAENASGDQTLEYLGSRSSGYDAGHLRWLCDALQNLAGPGSLRLECARSHFPTGQALLDWLKEAGMRPIPEEVDQDDSNG